MASSQSVPDRPSGGPVRQAVHRAARASLASGLLALVIACPKTTPAPDRAGTSDLPARVDDPGAAPAKDVTRIPVTIETEKGPLVVQSEIADTDASRMRGLMFRKNLGAREGMLFLFPEERPLTFWMRNTLIPLDMIFIKADHSILGIVENATPVTETPRGVPGSSQFVLEVAGGVAATEGIKAGQMVKFYAPVPKN